MLYNAGMKGHIQKAFSKFEFSHEKFWITDGQAVHLSTGMCPKENKHPASVLLFQHL